MRAHRVLGIVLVFALVGVALAGCAAGGGYGSSSTGGSSATGSKVVMKNTSFQPAELTVKAGTTVTWTNEDPVEHTVSGDGWDSGPISKGQTFKHTFDKAGTYSYQCTIHPTMTGKVIAK